jgi:hypothetical protein
LNLPVNWLSPYVDDIYPESPETFWQEVSYSMHSPQDIMEFESHCQDLDKKITQKLNKKHKKKTQIVDKPNQELNYKEKLEKVKSIKKDKKNKRLHGMNYTESTRNSFSNSDQLSSSSFMDESSLLRDNFI